MCYNHAEVRKWSNPFQTELKSKIEIILNGVKSNNIVMTVSCKHKCASMLLTSCGDRDIHKYMFFLAVRTRDIRHFKLNSNQLFHLNLKKFKLLKIDVFLNKNQITVLNNRLLDYRDHKIGEKHNLEQHCMQQHIFASVCI